MILSALKRRWPILTTIVAALLYVSNNYDIRGLEGLRLEPRSATTAGDYTQSPPAWQAAFPPNPRLPGNSSVASSPMAWPGQAATDLLAGGFSGFSPPPSSGAQSSGTQSPSTGLPISLPAHLGLPSTSPPSTSTPSTSSPNAASFGNSPGSNSAFAGAGAPLATEPRGLTDQWGQVLSLGEKLGMLEVARSPTPPIVQPVVPPAGANVATAPVRPSDSIRIASFNLDGYGERRQSGASVELIARLISQFDVIAMQGIRSKQDDVLPDLISRLNASGRKYDFMIGPRVGRTERREQFAFVFDTDRIETDRFQLYSVEDPEDMLHREPLVGWFRAVGPAAQDAFTFSLVNLRIDPDFIQSELETLPFLVQAVSADGRGEDDIILAGDFSASVPQLSGLSTAGMRVLLEGISTTPRGNQQLDSFAFPSTATSEFTGRSGAYDFLRQYNLSLERALEVSEHLPIWAEFSIMEGGRPGQVAGATLPDHRFQNRVN